MEFFWELVVILFVLLVNAFFSAYEMALASISRIKLLSLVSLRKKGAPEALLMKDRMEASLGVIQVGITIVGAIAAATAGVGLTESTTPFFQNLGLSETLSKIVSVILLIIPLSFLTIIFAELIPKTFALNHKEFVCLNLSKPIKLLAAFIYPVILIMERVVKSVMKLLDKNVPLKREEESIGLHELTAVVSLARASRLIGAQEEKIVLSAANLSLRPIREIMLPATDISMIPLRFTLSEALLKAHMDMHTRFPVCTLDDDPQMIEGYINFKDIMAALRLNPKDPSLVGIIRPIKRILESTSIAKVLEQMIHEKLHIALICSQEGRVGGLVTLEDIIEELVGDIEDEFDRIPNYIHPYGQSWIMGGSVLMTQVAKTLNLEWNPGTTGEQNLKLTDWCEKKLGETLQGGEVIKGNGLEVTVRKLRRKRLSEGIVRKIE